VTEAAGSGGWFGGPTPPTGTAAPADETARVARRLATPSTGTTRSGLPVRVPQAHLVPGAFGGDAPSTGAGRAPERSADQVRRRLDDYQRGVRRARPPDTP
jgi:hypothetical protein